MRRLWLVILLVGSACGGGGADRPDAGACPVQPLTYAWPSEDDPQVCARPPTTEVRRTQCGNVDEDCANDGVATPQLDCLAGPPVNPPPDPATVTLTGYADVFSSGPDSDGARIQVYEAAALAGVTDFSQATPIATYDLKLDATTVAEARACPQKTDEPEQLHGRCVQPETTCAACPRALDAVDFCWSGSCWPLQRWEVRYAIPNVPTNKFLVIRTIGLLGGSPNPAHETWAPLVQYNVFLSTAERTCQSAEDENCMDMGAPPVYRMNVNLLSRGDYQSIPQTMGLSAGITPGHGAVAGEVHDCSDVRLEFAQVGYSRLPLKIAYFNGNPVKTLPQLGRTEGTDAMGLYAGLDLTPGPLRVEAIGLVGGSVVSLGAFEAQIWPDAVTVIGINGGKGTVSGN